MQEKVWLYRFPNLARSADLVQAVSGRLGGASRGHLSSLNLSLVVHDERETVLANRQRLAEALGIPHERLLKSRQVHGSDCLVVGRGEIENGLTGLTDSPLIADGMLTAERELFLFMTFADCVPVLLHDPVRGVVGLVHAGWKGTAAGIVRRAVLLAQEAFGCRPGDILAGIGPSIGPCCYEVGPDVASAVQRALPAHAEVSREVAGGSIHLDLWRANACQLEEVGVPAANVEIAGLCSACRTDLFFSHRKERGKTGRMGAVIGLRGG